MIIYASMIISLFAALIPLRRPGVMLAKGIRGPDRPHWGLFIPLCCVTAIGASYGAWQLVDQWRGEQKTVALLSGGKKRSASPGSN